MVPLVDLWICLRDSSFFKLGLSESRAIPWYVNDDRNIVGDSSCKNFLHKFIVLELFQT